MFAGIRVQQAEYASVILDQREYILSLKELDKNSTYDDFRSYRHKLAWIASTLPDITATSNIYSQVTQDTFTVENIKQMNKSIRYLHEFADASLRYNHIELDKAKLVVFADGSHASNQDQSSQIGYLIFLTDGKEWH